MLTVSEKSVSRLKKKKKKKKKKKNPWLVTDADRRFKSNLRVD